MTTTKSPTQNQTAKPCSQLIAMAISDLENVMTGMTLGEIKELKDKASILFHDVIATRTVEARNKLLVAAAEAGLSIEIKNKRRGRPRTVNPLREVSDADADVDAVAA